MISILGWIELEIRTRKQVREDFRVLGFYRTGKRKGSLPEGVKFWFRAGREKAGWPALLPEEEKERPMPSMTYP